MLLNEGEYEIELDNANLKNIIVKVKYLHKTFKTVLPKSLNKHGFGKYNIPIKLYNLIILKAYQIDYDEFNKQIYLTFSNIVFEPDNKIYNYSFTISLEEYVDYQDFNMDTIIKNIDKIDLELAKKLLILNYNHIGILEKKINILEEKNDSLKSNHYDYDSDYGKF